MPVQVRPPAVFYECEKSVEKPYFSHFSFVGCVCRMYVKLFTLFYPLLDTKHLKSFQAHFASAHPSTVRSSSGL